MITIGLWPDRSHSHLRWWIDGYAIQVTCDVRFTGSLEVDDRIDVPSKGKARRNRSTSLTGLTLLGWASANRIPPRSPLGTAPTSLARMSIAVWLT